MPCNTHISINGPIYAFSTTCIKILPASTHYPIPKTLSLFKIFVTAIAHFPVLKPVLDSCGCYTKLPQTWWFKIVFSSCFRGQSPKLSYVGCASFGCSREKSAPCIFSFFFMAVIIPWLHPFLLCLHIIFPLVHLIYLCLSCIRTFMMEFGGTQIIYDNLISNP